MTTFSLLLFLAACGGKDHNGHDSTHETGADSADTGDSGPVGGDCEVGSKTGAAGETDGLETEDSIVYNVRAPEDYDATVAHPLIVVYAPAGGDPESTERFTGLSDDALDAGYVIAYADHYSPTSTRVIEKLAGIPADVSAKWCIDQDRIYLTGHSDGGSITAVIAIMEMLKPAPAAVAPSAAGVDQSWVETAGCPEPLPVMVMHSAGDTLFPESKGFGAAVAAWWAACDQCDAKPGAPLADGCLPYENCTAGTEVLFCEGSGQHGVWPNLNDSMMGFFGRHPTEGP
jgi:polyhydroxybutyrate depolymerase